MLNVVISVFIDCIHHYTALLNKNAVSSKKLKNKLNSLKKIVKFRRLSQYDVCMQYYFFKQLY